jgi:single-stranded-DNA-specific exonuclease
VGITGLVASRLAERYHRPAAVARVDEDTARGSTRTIDQFNVVAALEQVSDLLVKYGGHAKAAGFTVRTEDLTVLRERFSGIAARELDGVDLRPTLSIDAEVEPGQLGRPLYDALEALAPFGEGNRRPLLVVRSARTSRARVVGANHLKFAVEGVHEGASMDAISFGLADRLEGLAGEGRVDLVGRLVENVWRGKRQIEMHVQDFAASE